jgi:phage/plasmid-like protein (TIGR03299 family)
MTAYFDTGFSVREPMWHGLGNILADYPADWPAARKFAGLEWEPELRPMVEARCADCGNVLTAADLETGACGSCLSTAPPTVALVPGEARVIRNDTGLHLGSVTDQYAPIGHDVMGEVMETLAETSDGTLRFETAGSVREGRNVWALAYLDEPIEVAGDDTATLPFLALLNAHDGSGALRVVPTSVRVVCWNTYRAAEMQGERTGQQFTFRHVGDVRERVEDAKNAIRGVRTAQAEWVKLAEQLAGFRVDEAAVANFISSFIPEPVEAIVSDRVRSNVQRARGTLARIIAEEPTCDGHRGTALGLVDGAVEYLDHVRAFRSRDTLMNRTMLRPEPMKAKLVELAMAAAS